MTDNIPLVIFAFFCGATSALFFHLHRTDEGPAMVRAGRDRKADSLSYAYGWFFAFASVGLVIAFLAG
jgi:hypothetical protein